MIFHDKREQQRISDACYLFGLESPTESPAEHEHSNSMEKNLTKICNKAFEEQEIDLVAICDEKINVAKLNHSVDICVQDKNTGETIAYVELDGDYHMLRAFNGRGERDIIGYNQGTGLQTLLNWKASPDTQIIRIPYMAHMRLKGMDESTCNQKIADLFNAVKKGETNGIPIIGTFGDKTTYFSYPINMDWVCDHA